MVECCLSLAFYIETVLIPAVCCGFLVVAGQVTTDATVRCYEAFTYTVAGQHHT